MLWHVMTWLGHVTKSQVRCSHGHSQICSSYFLTLPANVNLSTCVTFLCNTNGYIKSQPLRSSMNCFSGNLLKLIKFLQRLQSLILLQIMHKLQNQCISGHFFGKTLLNWVAEMLGQKKNRQFPWLIEMSLSSNFLRNFPLISCFNSPVLKGLPDNRFPVYFSTVLSST